MISRVNKVIGFISILGLFICLAELPIRKGYLNYKLADTQYEKLLWLMHQFDSGILRNNHFDIVLFGSSSSLYGFNDSVTTSKSINLGVNTGSRALELFILNQFLSNGNTSKYWVKEFHSLHFGYFDYYGLHPVLHYVTTPSWLIRNGQSILQPHFLQFVFNRIKVVIQSWFFFHLNKNYDPAYTHYGYRPKNKVVSSERYSKVLEAELFDPSKNFTYSGFLNMWRHNFSAVKSFRNQFDNNVQKEKSRHVSYLFHPSLKDRIERTALLNRVINTLGHDFQLNVLKCNIDSAFFYDRSNWADEGHYSNEGAIFFTKHAEQIILSSK
jgi:hypothetical protein